ncbi:MAG TPA: hypothetical protein VFG20_09955 [Planctomycetaceae bacterium]|nr:hypothetical protein [Planctomycetaceae bacterium]
MARWCLLLILATVVSMAGCASMMHELQPHRLNRLNRNPPPSMDPEFTSVTTGGSQHSA